MKTFNILKIALAISLIFITGTAFAHAHLEHTSPADGASLDVTPMAVDMEFGEPVILTKLEVKGQDDMVPVSFRRRSDASKNFSVSLPSLEAGSYTVSWSALSEEDGHPMNGHFSFTVAGH